jgi:hypothetical protein
MVRRPRKGAPAPKPRHAAKRPPERPAPIPDIFTDTEIRKPTIRPLNIYAFDPSVGRFVGNSMTALVRYERLDPGPIGERFAVIDYDGTNKTFYEPIKFDDARVTIGTGLEPSESDPRFHQQMVYAVACETLQRFEYALGRRIHWRGGKRADGDMPVPRGASLRLNLHPHAMCQANAFYSPAAHAVLFGYFKASRTQPGRNLPGQTIFTCLSHDIIAHEVTHAIVDGIRRYFSEPTNIDVPAFHEAFADLAALFLHFSHEDALLDTLQKTGGKLFAYQLKPDAEVDGNGPMIQAQLASPNPLIELALQFGEAAGMRGGLRSALGTPPNSNDIKIKTEPHDRGAILVAAVFDAYFTIYTRRTSELFRIFRAGGGAMSPADLPGPLATRLAAEASHTAEHFFTICARAIDYCPPVDITFGDFLRALLTASLDKHPTDPDGVRDALMQAFRLRGIVAEGARSFSEESLCWPKVASGKLPSVAGLQFGDPNGLTKTEKDINGDVLCAYAKKYGHRMGLDPDAAPIQAPSFHPMFHKFQDGRLYVDLVVELVQTVERPFDDEALGTFPMRNGVTLLISQDPSDSDVRPEPQIRFVIPKLHSAEREERIRTYYMSTGRALSQRPDRFQIDFGLVHAGA